MMEFTTFNAETCPQQLGGKYHTYKNLTLRGQGCLTISRQVAEEYGLTKDARIVFLQDKRFPTDWYIQKTTDDKGYTLKHNKNGSVSFVSAPLSRAIINSAVPDVKKEKFITLTFPLIDADNGLALDIKHYRMTK